MKVLVAKNFTLFEINVNDIVGISSNESSGATIYIDHRKIKIRNDHDDSRFHSPIHAQIANYAVEIFRTNCANSFAAQILDLTGKTPAIITFDPESTAEGMSYRPRRTEITFANLANG